MAQPFGGMAAQEPQALSPAAGLDGADGAGAEAAVAADLVAAAAVLPAEAAVAAAPQLAGGGVVATEAATEQPAGTAVIAGVAYAASVDDWVARQTFDAQECPVCFEAMGGACPIQRLSCGHGFHVACIQRWLQQHPSCPLCKAEAPSDQPVPKNFKVDLGHQEMAQILGELEDIFQAVHACAGPDRPVALSGLAYNLCVSLGYEDEDELEEAIGCTLADFLGALPHFEVHWPAAPPAQPPPSPCGEPEPGAEAAAAPPEPEPRATMTPEPAASLSGPGCRTVFTVSQREDLWRVVLQGPYCNIEIPELEFVIRPRERRKVDTIYNLIASAVFHLGDHVRKSSRAGAMTEDEATQICAAIDGLNQLLDLEQPFTVVLSDRQGVSELKPSDGTHHGPWIGGIAEEDEEEVEAAAETA